MDSSTLLWIALLMGLAAALYSTVGHGGASAYLAIMALFAVAPETMRPTALALNLVVAGLAGLRYWRAGQINLRLLAAFALTAAPAAFVGGAIQVPPRSLPADGRAGPVGGRGEAVLAAGAAGGTRAARPLPRRHPPGRSGPRTAGRADRHRRRHLPQPADHPVRLGGRAPDVGSRRRLHLHQLAGRPRRQLAPRCARCPPSCRSWSRRWRRAPWSAPGSAPAACRSRDCSRAWRWSWSSPERS